MDNHIVEISCRAHMNYMIPRILEKEKQQGFKTTMNFLLGKLIYHKANKVLSLPEVVNYVLLNYGDAYFGFKAGANLAIDTFKEICDNTQTRFETGYSNESVVTRIL